MDDVIIVVWEASNIPPQTMALSVVIHLTNLGRVMRNSYIFIQLKTWSAKCWKFFLELYVFKLLILVYPVTLHVMIAPMTRKV